MTVNKVRETIRFLHSTLKDFPRHHLIMASAVGCCLLVVALYPVSDAEANRKIAEPIDIPVATQPLTIAPEEITPALSWTEQRVSSGDSLSTLFTRAELTAIDVYQVSSSQDGKLLRNLYPGELFRFGLDSVGQLQELHHVQSKLVSRVFTREGKSYSSEQRVLEPDTLLNYREGVIKDSLYMSGLEADLPDKLIMELANIFAWDIDFVFDIRKEDSFSLLFEENFLEGEKLSVGDIVAATFTNRGKTYQAVRYTNDQGVSNYYTPEGLSMRKAFLRTPLDIFRISSGFNLKRKHPIHKKIKAHRGVDYAAPRGTPVYSAGDGKVIAAGYSKANGNYVFVQHGQTYITKYLHLNKKKVRKGQSVRQRQLIGTVGSTGYATGPHLHYEFLVNGVHRNPRTVKLPQANPIPKAEFAAFQTATQPMLRQLAQHGGTSTFAGSKAAADVKSGTNSAN
ncbi:MAG: peptidoglycan DD-metalloendopeptidase family protein [Porticoccaceae bacterium]|nr:peptidoglycan DD-metalloendopeptidase family protein [Porticoccaceae bacterium]